MKDSELWVIFAALSLASGHGSAKTPLGASRVADAMVDFYNERFGDKVRTGTACVDDDAQQSAP